MRFGTTMLSTEIKVISLRKQHGITLIELLVIITIVLIIISIATPSFKEWQEKMEAKRVEGVLMSILRQAKSESFITKQDTLFCLSNGAGRCHRNSDKELLLFIDRNNNRHFDALIDELIIKETTNLKYGRLFLRMGSRRHYTKFFGNTGLPRGHMGHIKYCPFSENTNRMFLITISNLGKFTPRPYSNRRTGC